MTAAKPDDRGPEPAKHSTVTVLDREGVHDPEWCAKCRWRRETAAKPEPMTEEELESFRSDMEIAPIAYTVVTGRDAIRLLATIDRLREEVQEDSAALKSVQGALVDSGLPVGPQDTFADTVRELTAERDAHRDALAAVHADIAALAMERDRLREEVRERTEALRELYGDVRWYEDAKDGMRLTTDNQRKDIDRLLAGGEGEKGGGA